MSIDEKRFRELEKTVKENNKILHQIRRGHRWAKFWRFLYWLLLAGVALVSYYYIHPYIVELQQVYEQLQSGVDSIQEAGDSVNSIFNRNTES